MMKPSNKKIIQFLTLILIDLSIALIIRHFKLLNEVFLGHKNLDINSSFLFQFFLCWLLTTIVFFILHKAFRERFANEILASLSFLIIAHYNSMVLIHVLTGGGVLWQHNALYFLFLTSFVNLPMGVLIAFNPWYQRLNKKRNDEFNELIDEIQKRENSKN